MSPHSLTPELEDAAALEAIKPRYPELQGRVAVITGGAQGIGQGIALRLAAEGMRLVLADMDEGALDTAAELLRSRGTTVLAVVGDVSRTADVDRMFAATMDSLGTVDLLVNNAADLHRRRLLDEHEALLDLQLAVNVRGPYICSQRAAAIMRDAGGGNIVHLSSVGALRAHHRGFPYDVTKGAINAMTMAMAVDLGEYGIRVNTVGPGVTYTHRAEGRTDNPQYRAAIAGIPLRRSGTIFDVASTVAFLASDEATYITGQVLYVDGGMTAQLTPPAQDEMDRLDKAAQPAAEGGADG